MPYAQLGSSNPCAWCKLHHVGLSARQIKTKGCLGKQCWYLKPIETHKYWDQRRATKQKRRERQDRLEEEYRRATHKDE